MMGFGISICYPGFFAFFEQFFNLTDRISAIMISSTGLLCALTPFLTGRMIENNPLILLYINGIGITGVIILFAVANFIVHQAEIAIKSSKEREREINSHI